MMPPSLRWEFLGSRTRDGDLGKVISSPQEREKQERGTEKGWAGIKSQRASSFTVIAGDPLEDSGTIVGPSLKQRGSILYPCANQSLLEGSFLRKRQLWASSQSSWEVGVPAGKWALDRAPTPPPAPVYFRRCTVHNAVLNAISWVPWIPIRVFSRAIMSM